MPLPVSKINNEQRKTILEIFFKLKQTGKRQLISLAFIFKTFHTLVTLLLRLSMLNTKVQLLPNNDYSDILGEFT